MPLALGSLSPPLSPSPTVRKIKRCFALIEKAPVRSRVVGLGPDRSLSLSLGCLAPAPFFGGERRGGLALRFVGFIFGVLCLNYYDTCVCYQVLPYCRQQQQPWWIFLAALRCALSLSASPSCTHIGGGREPLLTASVWRVSRGEIPSWLCLCPPPPSLLVCLFVVVLGLSACGSCCGTGGWIPRPGLLISSRHMC